MAYPLPKIVASSFLQVHLRVLSQKRSKDLLLESGRVNTVDAVLLESERGLLLSEDLDKLFMSS
jgi:hypothetical protein